MHYYYYYYFGPNCMHYLRKRESEIHIYTPGKMWRSEKRREEEPKSRGVKFDFALEIVSRQEKEENRIRKREMRMTHESSFDCSHIPPRFAYYTSPVDPFPAEIIFHSTFFLFFQSAATSTYSHTLIKIS